MNWTRQDYWESDPVVDTGRGRSLVAIVRKRKDGKYWWWIEFTDRPYRSLSAGVALHLRYAKEKAEFEMKEIVRNLIR